jgi:hypothetical protein
MPRTDAVFGIRTKLVESYIERYAVDTKFREALESDHHVVVYGSSKQGKTSLRQKHLPSSRCLVIRCGPRMTIAGLYQSILRQAGVQLRTAETYSTEASGQFKVTGGFVAKIPLIGSTEISAEGSLEKSAQQELTTEFIAHDHGDAQSVAELLGQIRFEKWIVLENYHYLPEATQKAIAFDLKTFHEVGIRFLILGIWREANLLVTHNGDLQDRLIEIPVEPWLAEDLGHIATLGCQLLNIEIEKSILQVFRDSSFGNVGLFQEFLKTFCLRCGIRSSGAFARLNDEASLKETIAEKLETQTSSLVKSLQGIAAKSRVRRGELAEPLLLPYYLMLVLLELKVERLQEGIERTQLLELIRAVHRRPDKDTIRMSDVTNLLVKLPSYQVDMHPPLLYYDGNSRRLRIVDGRVYFVLKNADRATLKDEIPIPDADTDERDPRLLLESADANSQPEVQSTDSPE